MLPNWEGMSACGGHPISVEHARSGKKLPASDLVAHGRVERVQRAEGRMRWCTVDRALWRAGRSGYQLGIAAEAQAVYLGTF